MKRDIHLSELLAAAKAVTWFDWSGNDLDALMAIQRLSDAIARYELERPRITAAQLEKKFIAAIRDMKTEA